jgi:hypothetical protein
LDPTDELIGFLEGLLMNEEGKRKDLERWKEVEQVEDRENTNPKSRLRLKIEMILEL